MRWGSFGFVQRACETCRHIFLPYRRSLATASPSQLNRSVVEPRVISTLQTIPTSTSNNPSSQLEECFGGDREALVYRSFEDFVPIDTVGLPGRIFNAPVRTDIVHRVVHWQLAKRRAGTASSKSRSEVAGSGRKIRPQKGSGRSRQGASTSPIFRGGGRAQGPKPRDFSYPLPHDIRRNGLRSVLTSKFFYGKLWIVDDLRVPEGKTKTLVRAIDKIGFRSVYVIDDVPDAPAGVESSFGSASHNVQGVLAMSVRGINVYDLLSFDMTVLSRSALLTLQQRFEKYYWLT